VTRSAALRSAILLALLAPAHTPAAHLTLDEALDAAARANADLALARAQRDTAGVDLYESYQGLLPRLDLSASFGRSFLGAQRSVNVVPLLIKDPASGNYSLGYERQDIYTPPGDFPDYQLGLVLRQPLFDGFAAWNQVARSRSAARAADRELDEEGLRISFDVTRRFYELVKAEQSLAVLQETAARSEELVRRADALFAAGRGSKADTYAARVNLGNDRIAVEAQRSRVEQARADLAVALGRNADPELSAVPPSTLDGAGAPAGVEPPPAGALLDRARRARPLLQARSALVGTADLDVKVAHGGWWPVLFLEGTYLRQGTSLRGAGGVYDDLSRQYSGLARLVVQWNLFSGRQTAAAERRAEVAAHRARLQAEQAEQQVSAEIARARSAVVALARSAALSRENLSAAESGLRLARERLDAGAASQLEVRDAALKLAQAKLDLLSARIDHAVAVADLNRAVGGTL